MQLLYVANRYERQAAICDVARRRPDPRLRSLPGVEHRLRRGAGPRSGVAGRDPEVPAAAVADDPARHRAGDGRRSARPRSRPVRARPRAARRACARATAGRRAAQDWVRLDGERPKDVDRRRRVHARVRRHDSRCRKRRAPRATPASFSTRAHASSVAPVVLTSSTRTTIAPASVGRARARRRERASHVAVALAAGRSACGGVCARSRRRAPHHRQAEVPREIARPD